MPETYGERIAQARQEMGLTQEEFALRSGVKPRTLQDIENGKVAKPQKRTRDRIDAFLGLRAEGETAAEWPPDLGAFLRILGAFLFALPDDERETFINDMIVRLARWNRD